MNTHTRLKTSLVSALLLIGVFGQANAETVNKDGYSTPTIYQPDAEYLDDISVIYNRSMEGFDFKPYGKSKKIIIHNGIPYAQYWQLKDPNQYVLHPMVFGRYVFNNVDDPEFRSQIQDITQKVGTALPNGGIGFYYPNRYPLNRMTGPDVVYSAISQSEILAGYLKLYMLAPTSEHRALLDKVKKGLFFPFGEGGVHLPVAQLELPTLRSNPEIILNGWLHSLLYLNDYAIFMNDDAVAGYIDENIAFLVDHHQAWYDEEKGISLYSDTSPHRATVLKSQPTQDFKVRYKSKTARLKSYEYVPVDATETKYSGYDTSLLLNAEKKAVLRLTCSNLYDTVIMSDARFDAKIRVGGYAPNRATPDNTGDLLTFSSTEIEGAHQLSLEDAKSAGLICGYPTNFKKANSKNFYHMQHITALLYLAKEKRDLPQALQTKMVTIALRWLSANERFNAAYPDLKFEEGQRVLDGINRGKVYEQASRFEDLVAWGREVSDNG